MLSRFPRHLLAWPAVMAARRAVQVASTRVQARMGLATSSLVDERSITGALVLALEEEFDGLQGSSFAFRAKALGLRAEAATKADIAILLQTPQGAKWILVQAKYGPRTGHEWKHLVEAQCPAMTHPARVLVYYADRFISADARKVETRGAPKPPTSLTHPIQPVPPWFDFDRSMEFFFQCWGGSRSALPHPLQADFLVVLAMGQSDSEASGVLAETLLGLGVASSPRPNGDTPSGSEVLDG